MTTKPPITLESLTTATEYVQQSADLGEDSTSLTNAFLLRVFAVAREALSYAEVNPNSTLVKGIKSVIDD